MTEVICGNNFGREMLILLFQTLYMYLDNVSWLRRKL